MEAPIFPILIDTGGFALHSYGFMGALGFVVLCVLSLRDARRAGWEQEAIVDVIFWTAIAGIAGSRAVYLIQTPEVVHSAFDIINLRTGGLVFYGAFLGLPVGVWLARRHGLPVADVADVFGRSMPLAHGMARIGCVLAGCCWGLPTDLPWAIHYEHPLAPGPHGVGLHPVQLYEAFGLFALSGFLTWLAPRKRFSGQVMLAYVMLYAVLRSITETFRGDAERGFFWESALGQHVSTSQAVAVVFLLGGGALWWRLSRAAPEPA